MPVAALVCVPSRHDYQVAESGRDLLLTAGAEVGLASLKGMDEAHFEFVVGPGVVATGAAAISVHVLILVRSPDWFRIGADGAGQ
jgi:hypothetical protein